MIGRESCKRPKIPASHSLIGLEPLGHLEYRVAALLEQGEEPH
jgi:hypothetical protein